MYVETQEPKERPVRNLVVLRAGSKSLHRNWISSKRSWKLAISSFDVDNAAAFPEADYFHYFKGGKWDGIHAFFQTNPGLVDEYDQVWLPDDDIDSTSLDIETLFNLTAKYELEVAQPSLTNDSYFTHPITLRNFATKIRYTNFVEIMVPVLNKEVLKTILPLFQFYGSGFGFDYIFGRVTSDPLCKCAILDEISVRHTRPVGSVLAKELKKQGFSGQEELEDLSHLVGYDLDNVRPVCFALTTQIGFKIRSRFLCGLLQFLVHAPWRSAGRNRKPGFRVFGGSLYSHFVRKPELTKIDAAQVLLWLESVPSPDLT